jgi:Ribbon-helix-helix protein, copG family
MTKFDKEIVTFSAPRAVIERVDQLAADELISRSAWLRRTIAAVAIGPKERFCDAR